MRIRLRLCLLGIVGGAGALGACVGDTTPVVDGGQDVTTTDVTQDVAPDVESDSMADAGPPTLPSLQTANHLKLWFTADYGVQCTAGHVTQWNDISGNANNATPPPNAVGPRCGVANHTMNGVSTPFFSAPPEPDGGPYVDETLQLPILATMLANAGHYTIFVVDRRWADFFNASRGNFLLGTDVPSQVLQSGCANYANSALQLGYVYYNAKAQFVLDQTCNGALVDVAAVPNAPPVAASFEMARFGPLGDGALGHDIWVNGVLKASGTANNGAGLGANLTGGSIGRAYATSADARFNGDIAEILVFDTNIPDADRTALETYLRNHWKQTF